MPTAARDPTIAAVLKRPFAEQVAFFRGKLGNLVPTATWRDLWKSQHDRAFMVAGAAKADLLADLAAAVDAAIAQGETLQAFRARFAEIVQRRGWHGWTGEETPKGRAWRTRVIYQTNLSTSYAAGRLAQLKSFPLWVYKHSDSVLHPRPQHVAWDGLTLPADHPFWSAHYPPNGWGCRCRVVGASGPNTARRVGGSPDKPLPPDWDAIDTKTGEPVGIDKGWGYQPGATVAEQVRVLAPKIDALPPPLAAEVKASVEDVNPQDSVRKLTREVLESARRDTPGVEYAGLIDGNGRRLWIKRGGQSYVEFTGEEIARMPGGVLVHNHPSSRSLSSADLILAQVAQLKRIYAAGADGSIYVARVPDGVTRDAITSAHAVADRQIRDMFINLIDAGTIRVHEAERYHHHAVNLLLARRGIIRYHAVLDGRTPQWVYDVVKMVAK